MSETAFDLLEDSAPGVAASIIKMIHDIIKIIKKDKLKWKVMNFYGI